MHKCTSKEVYIQPATLAKCPKTLILFYYNNLLAGKLKLFGYINEFTYLHRPCVRFCSKRQEISMNFNVGAFVHDWALGILAFFSRQNSSEFLAD